MVKALPLGGIVTALGGAEPEPLPADDASLWLYLGIAIALVLAGGVFAGLTIAYVLQHDHHGSARYAVTNQMEQNRANTTQLDGPG